MNDWLRLHKSDHVVIALRDFVQGETIEVEVEDAEEGQRSMVIEMTDAVSRGHKILIRTVAKGEDILKFGYSIGKAKESLVPGCWVHTHNLGTGLKGFLEYTYEPTHRTLDAWGRGCTKDSSVVADSVGTIGGTTTDDPAITMAALAPYSAEPDEHTQLTQPTEPTFNGYARENGDVGIRNEIWIINTVGCINKTCELLARSAEQQFGGRVDGIYHFAHPFGCSQLGDDLANTQQLLASLALHPNAGGVLVVGLGCENNQVEAFKQVLGDFDRTRILFMKTQDERDELEAGLALIEQLVIRAEQYKREPIPIAKLKIGLKCGGSDGFSGITGNPLVGVISDRLTALGGTAILTEVPEMFGAETILMNRAADSEVFEKIVALINDFKQYFLRHDQEIYENPSPGNKDGGISTLEEKSLGCTQKGGHAVVTDVLAYGHRVKKPGLNLLEGPGNDLVSVTALTAAGAHFILFTTGRGTPFGGPVPTVKISTNSDLANRKKNWIDFNAGQLLENKNMDQLSEELWIQLMKLASGEIETHNERNGYREIAIFKDGVIL